MIINKKIIPRVNRVRIECFITFMLLVEGSWLLVMVTGYRFFYWILLSSKFNINTLMRGSPKKKNCGFSVKSFIFFLSFSF